MINHIVVGAGIAGITLARRIAEEKDEKVLIVDKNNYIGGYCNDYRSELGIIVHRKGPHIFRTDNKRTWHFLSRFTKWHLYQHKVLTYVQGQLLPMPINLDTVNGFLGTHYNSLNVMEYFENERDKTILTPSNVKEVITSQIGTVFYKYFFENYTKKQWGVSPEDLPPEIISRIPIRTTKEDRYFICPYQGIPVNGYTSMFENMLRHPNISLLLQTDWRQIKDYFPSNVKVYYSGSIDDYFENILGCLEYRCVNFELDTIEKEFYQPTAVVNYPNDYDFTRITEYKYFLPLKVKVKKTIIAKEYSSANGDKSYPVPTNKNKELYSQYMNLHKNKNVKFIGRLGKYKYYSMDEIVNEILDMNL